MLQSGSNSDIIFDLKRWFAQSKVNFRDFKLSNGECRLFQLVAKVALTR